MLKEQVQHKPGEASNVVYKVPGVLVQQLFDDWRAASLKKG